ncbi:hypothetical protein Tco_1396260 [Tanacetum coccineum]
MGFGLTPPVPDLFTVSPWYRIFTKGRKTKPTQRKPRAKLERARKTEAKGAKGLKTELKRILLDRLDNGRDKEIEGWDHLDWRPWQIKGQDLMIELSHSTNTTSTDQATYKRKKTEKMGHNEE